MLQIAIDFMGYVVAALVGAVILFAFASAGVVEIPRRAKRMRITKENQAARSAENPMVGEAGTECFIPIFDANSLLPVRKIAIPTESEGSEPRHVREIVLPLPKRSELGDSWEKTKAGSIEDALRGVPL